MFKPFEIIIGLMLLLALLVLAWCLKLLISFCFRYRQEIYSVIKPLFEKEKHKEQENTLKALIAVRKPIFLQDDFSIFTRKDIDISFKKLLPAAITYNPQDVKGFVDFLEHTNLEPEIKINMSKEMIRQNPKVLQKFLDLLSNRLLNENILCGIVQALGYVQEPQAIPVLHKLLLQNLNNTLLRAYVVKMLGKFKVSNELPFIMTNLYQLNINSKEEITCFVDAIIELDAVEEVVLSLRTVAQLNFNNEFDRIIAVIFLGEFDADESIPDLLNIFSNPFIGKSLKKAVIHTLIRFNAKNEIPKLKSILDNLTSLERHSISGFITPYQVNSMNTNTDVKVDFFKTFLKQKFYKKDIRKLLKYMRSENAEEIRVLISKELLKIGRKEKINIYYTLQKVVKPIRFFTAFNKFVLNLLFGFPIFFFIILLIFLSFVRSQIVYFVNKLGLKIESEKFELFEKTVLKFYSKVFPQATLFMTGMLPPEVRKKYFGK